MLLPQSSAFAALKNRLNSVSAIGYLHIPLRPYHPPPPFRNAHVTPASNPITPSASTATFERPDRPNRLKARDEGGIRWTELLEKFRAVQERARRALRGSSLAGFPFDDVPETPDVQTPLPVPATDKERRAVGLGPGIPESRVPGPPGPSVPGFARSNTPTQRASISSAPAQGPQPGKPKPGLGFGRLAGGVAGRKTKR